MNTLITQVINKKISKNFLLFLRENKKTFLTVLILSVIEDIFFQLTSSDLLTFSLLTAYVFFMLLFKIKSSFTFLLCLALLTVMSINYVFTGASVSTEKAAVWFILFFVVGVVQQWKE